MVVAPWLAGSLALGRRRSNEADEQEQPSWTMEARGERTAGWQAAVVLYECGTPKERTKTAARRQPNRS